MEESEKRRERLKAMRMEAANSDVIVDSESTGMVSHSLSNPLIESEPAASSPVQYSRPRFDFYTDPMSAFSANKRRSNLPHQVSRGYSNRPPHITSTPAYQNAVINSPGERPIQSPGAHYRQSSSFETPVGAARSFQGNTSSTWGGLHGNFNNHAPNMSTNISFPSSGFGRGDSLYAIHGRGRGGRYSSSPLPHLHSHNDSGHGGTHYPYSGRGRVRSVGGNLNAGIGPSGRRGQGSHDSVSAMLRPDLYYRKEMLEDPWKSITPVIWKGVNSDKSWHPKSISVKKARASSEAPLTSVSQQSLAECLAASFNETVADPDT